MRRHTSRLLPAALLTLALLALVIRLPIAAAQRANDYALFDPIVDIHHLLSTHFFRDLDEDTLRAMQEGAIKGMIDAVDDPYTEYIPTRDTAEFDKEIRGEYAGIGAQVGTRDGWIHIVSPLEDSPAYRAGIEADDLVIAVNGRIVYKMPVDAVVGLLTGEVGTTVTLTIQRAGDADSLPPGAADPAIPGAEGEAPGPPPGAVRFDITLRREKIVTSTVKGVHRVGDRWSWFIDPVRRIGYVRVTQFTAGTIPELEAACRQLVAENMQGLILDLRFNGGGSLFAAIQMADLFLREGLIVSTRGRTTSEDKVYARAEGTLPDFPMVIILNEQSASASEVVAGALADNGRAVILGERSFGKGIVQTLYRLPSGAGQLKVTEQYYYLPSGRSIQRSDDSAVWGVDPTPGFYLPMTVEQYRDMIRVRREEEVIRRAAPDPEDQKNWADPQWILEHLRDPQLSAAVEAVRAKIDTGQWIPTGEEAPAGTIEKAEMRRLERRFELLLREAARVERRLNALSEATGQDPASPADLIPEGADLTGGAVEIRDKAGAVVATLRITDADLAPWLRGAPLRRADADDAP